MMDTVIALIIIGAAACFLFFKMKAKFSSKGGCGCGCGCGTESCCDGDEEKHSVPHDD
ncbi:FeoB-associated Cys-rich membrane protein [Pseudodesulfovibrio piezophilus]|nr:FeoB-associated Cys-rich membrane protein [Pseudodesulfovibrio piezophilus]